MLSAWFKTVDFSSDVESYGVNLSEIDNSIDVVNSIIGCKQAGSSVNSQGHFLLKD